MTRSILMTGCSGFVGTELIRRFDLQDFQRVYCLTRHGSDTLTQFASHPNCTVINGSIFDTEVYAQYLASCDTVIHLAAITGKASPLEYFDVNLKGTERLLEQCRQGAIKRFVYVSTIAVKFNKDAVRYYYAHSKSQAEEAVRNSGLSYVIVRPTMVIGPGGPIWQSLTKLARAPITPIFGDGRTKIQPIYVGDLAQCLLSILQDETLIGDTIELGGPEVTTIEDFIRRIHRSQFQKEPRVVHVPLGCLIKTIGVLENSLRRVLPFTAGQLCSFRNDGTIDRNPVFDRHFEQMKNVDEMISLASSLN